MKKLFVVLLAIVVLSSVAMIAIACGGDDETTTTEAMEETTVSSEADASTDADSTAITPAEGMAMGDALIVQYQEAGSPEDKTAFVTEEVTVAGPVFNVKDKSTFVIVAIGDDTASVNVLVPYEVFEAANLTLDDLSAWMGQDVEVTGTFVVNDFGSLAEIQVTDLTQIALQ